MLYEVITRAANYREANLFMVLMQLGLPGSILLTIFSVPARVSLTIYALPFFGTIVAIKILYWPGIVIQSIIERTKWTWNWFV